MDFKQGLITTIHEYGVTKESLEKTTQGLLRRPTAILIPCLFEEFKRPALNKTREVLKNLRGLNELVIALSAKTKAEVQEAEQFFSSMPYPVHIQWTNAPAVIELLQGQEKNGLDLIGTPGKGWQDL